MNLSDKSKYEGEYLANWYHGKGKYFFDNGVVYEGGFFKGEFHGEGMMSYPNGVSVLDFLGEVSWRMEERAS